MASELRETIPTFDSKAGEAESVGLSNWSGLTSANFAKSGSELLAIVLVAVAVIGGLEFWVRHDNVKAYILPRPSAVGSALIHHFGLFWPHIKVTLFELSVGY